MKIIEWLGDKQAVIDFYKSCDYQYHPSNDEKLITAVDFDNKLIGVVRLDREKKFTQLRGMQIHKNFQGQGIGTQMLKKFDEMTRGETCYLVGYPHLTKFYNQIGFVQIPTDKVPLEIQKRFQNALRRFPTTKFNIMVKKA